MKRWRRAAWLTVFLLATVVSCRQLYTTSLGTVFSRDSISISGSTSLDDLVDLASSSESTDPDVASEILSVLADKPATAILALSPDDKESILNLATTAAIDMETLTSLAKSATEEGADQNQLISDVFSAFDTSVDLTAIETLLADTDTLETAPVESIVFASATVLADAADAIGADALMDLLAADTPDLSAYPAQQAQIQLVLDVRSYLSANRADTDTEIAGFNLTDLLEGNQ